MLMTRHITSFFIFNIFLQNYDHLFKINEKKAGGSFYLQSKVQILRLPKRTTTLTTKPFKQEKNKQIAKNQPPPPQHLNNKTFTCK